VARVLHGYDRRMSPAAPFSQPTGDLPLPTDDELLRGDDLDLDGLAARWAPNARRRPISAAQMRGVDVRAQRLGVPVAELMEQAGAAVAAAARATLASHQRPASAPVLLLGGSGNNGGDAFVAARFLAAAGVRCVVVLVATADEPGTAAARAAWRALERLDGIEPMHAATAHEVGVLTSGIERVALTVDGLLGSGVRGPLRQPVAAAVELCRRARRLGVPILAVDTPTAVDLTSGEPSDPVVVADVTVTFHRPKEGLLTTRGSRFAGRVLVAPIGIPVAADPSA
jgi:ADP-dependent NAD(P)H-hydrate dehydratase / NAD(P)H-hydrate epimerase